MTWKGAWPREIFQAAHGNRYSDVRMPPILAVWFTLSSIGMEHR